MPVTKIRRKGSKGPEDDENEDRLMADEMVVVERPILTEFDFEQGFGKVEKPRRTPLSWIKRKAGKCVCSCACLRHFLWNFFPFMRILKGYSLKSDLPSDIVAGFTVGIMHIPQGMAYGQLSSLPPVFGLYVSFFPVILYFFLGTSRHISIGTFAVISLMIGSVVDRGLQSRGITLNTFNETITSDDGSTVFIGTDNSAEVLQAKLGLAMAVTFGVGCVQLLLGLLRLGFLTVYLSDPLVSGFTTGAACHVLTSQVKHIFGIEVGRYYGIFKLVYTYRDVFTALQTSNAVTLIASVVSVSVLVVVKEHVNNNPRFKPYLKVPIPVELCLVVLGTVISKFVKLNEQYDVAIVGIVPLGIPSPKVQQFTYLNDVFIDSITIGIVAFAISVSMAKILAKKHDYEIEPNQELLAYGTINICSSFFSSFVAAASLSRSLIQDNVGGRTQVAGMVSSALLLVVLLALGSYFETLPNCMLAAIILVALKGMFKQFAELRRLWEISFIDFMVWLVSFTATVILDVDIGLMVGVVFALLTVIIRQQRPHNCLLGQIPNTDIYKDVGQFKEAEELQHIKIFRFDSALFYANSEYFKSCMYKLTVKPVKLWKLKRRSAKELSRVSVERRRSSQSFKGSLTNSLTVMDETSQQKSPGAVCNNGSVVPAIFCEAAPSSNGTPTVDIVDSVSILPTVTDVYFIIIDCTTIGYMDSVGVKVLQQIVTEMQNFSIQVFFAHCKGAVRDMFEKTNFYQTSDKQCVFLTVHDAVLYCQRLVNIVEGDGVDGTSRVSLESIAEHSVTGCNELVPAETNIDLSPLGEGVNTKSVM